MSSLASSSVSQNMSSDDNSMGSSAQAADSSNLPSSSTGGMESPSDSHGNRSEYDSYPDTKRMKKTKDAKHCLVCGDKALGYNFNAITCESCKAFFRRNALKDQQLKCLFQGNCVIDIRTRRFCPYCRLNKCYDIGMKREMILDENERKARMQKVTQNRIRKQSGKKSPEYTGQFIKQEPPTDPELIMTEEETHAQPSCSNGHIEPPSCPLEVGIPPDGIPTDPSMFRLLSLEEKALLNEVTTAYRETVSSFASEKQLNEEDSYSNLKDIVNNSEIAVRRFIKFVKMLEDFKKLSQENQVATLKGCVLKTLLLRSVNFYDIEHDAWITPTGMIPSNVLKQAYGYGDLHSSHTSYCRTLKILSRGDEYVMTLLQLIVLFNPDGQSITFRPAISDLQDKYLLLLKHYLESSVSFLHSQRIFACLLKKLSELKDLGDEHAKILLQMNSNQIEPLMLEVLSIN